MKEKIKDIIDAFFFEGELGQRISEDINSGDYIDEGWDEEYSSMEDWYAEFGSREVETAIVDEILRSIAKEIGEPIDDWYFEDKYGDVDEMIYEAYPELK